MSTYTASFDAIGTHWEIECEWDMTVISWRRLRLLIDEHIEIFDAQYSRFRADSLITKMAKEGGEFLLPSNAKDLFSLYRKLYDKTNGSFTPLIGNLLSDSGYDAQYSLKEKELQAPTAWDDAMQYEFPALTIKQGEILDFGAAGKGYLVDIIGELLTRHGIHTFSIDAGGDILQKSKKKLPLEVGLEHPTDLEKVIGVAKICNQSICGSAGNRRKWGIHHHIFDPHTQKSTNTVLATWVVAPTAILADALATCLFFVPPETLDDEFSFEYVIVYPDMSVKRSESFPAELFLSA